MRILKFGGATVADPQKILNVANIVASHVRQGEKVIVVVSAMGKTTSDLITLAQGVSRNPHRREMDMLLSVGERITMALLSMALNDLNIPAVSLTGSQAGIITNDDHENAHITEIRPVRVQSYLDAGKTVIIAGFQGVSMKTKEITTLGRGGSDTTAVALAAHFKCRCEILKEMSSVFTADPKLFKNVKAVSEISFTLLKEMTFWGAKMLNPRAAQVACDNQTELFIGEAVVDSPTRRGTLVQSAAKSDQDIFINHHPWVMKLKVSQNESDNLADWVQKKFYDLSLHSPQILHIKKNELWITDHEDSFEMVRKTLNKQMEFTVDTKVFSTFSICSPSDTRKYFERLQTSNLIVHKILIQKERMNNLVLFFEKSQQTAMINWLETFSRA